MLSAASAAASGRGSPFHSLGSESIRDFAYASAALDPTPLPALVIMLLISWVPNVVFGFHLGQIYGRKRGKQEIERVEGLTVDDNEKRYELLKAKHKKLQFVLDWYGAVVLVILIFAAYATNSVVNQSVVVWRVFHANLTIISPYISAQDEKILRAKFASITSRNEYLLLADDIEKIAKLNHAKLVDIKTW